MEGNEEVTRPATHTIYASLVRAAEAHFKVCCPIVFALEFLVHTESVVTHPEQETMNGRRVGHAFAVGSSVVAAVLRMSPISCRAWAAAESDASRWWKRCLRRLAMVV